MNYITIVSFKKDGSLSGKKILDTEAYRVAKIMEIPEEFLSESTYPVRKPTFHKLAEQFGLDASIFSPDNFEVFVVAAQG